MTHLQAGLSPETIEKARLELNENPDILHQDIQQVRDMIITRPDIGFLRTDDAFILRFLRARKFHQTEAFRLLAQYFQYRQLNLDMFKNFKADDPGIKRALTDGFPGVLENRDHCGRKILLLFAANWDQSRNSFIDILRAILLSLEVLIEDQELQINGFILIIDWSNFSFKQASKLTPSILKLAIEGLQVPVRGGARHTETRRPRGKREHPTTAGSGLSSHTLHTHKQTSTIPETYRAHHTHTRAFCLRTSPSCLLTKSQLSPAICPCGQL
ncbi:clavesin-1 isoform X2 [Columba livia]|uniref:clavesin-1 isoform X2 n=1 Tax=Columba livia TaxID=8932 RepID=UPI000A3CC97C|nr:clavesin-1 isoform X2 [Columba livia]